ncbi:MAG TPA: AAA family ATPase, partial [Kineosporiaceae bacterium]|nr:AAA family ATPase [Kineosporiaceae bacterium]
VGFAAQTADGWQITDAGRKFLAEHPGEDLERENNRVYREHRKAQQPPTRRAWLVRGSSVGGVNVVPRWLEDGFVSLRAQRLTPTATVADWSDVVATVESAYASRGVAYRRRKATEYERFLRWLAVDDLVLTTAEGQVYLGRVSGEPYWAASDDTLPARLRRPVEWLNEEAPTPFAELPEPLPGRLAASADIVDLSTDLAVVESLLDADEEDDDDDDPSGGDVGPKPSDLRLPDVTQALADELFVDRAWLERLVRLLWRRKQVILYGPPGTGKTFIAQKLARALTDSGNVRLVQFHPSYAYEDFFEGYRPVTRDGHVVFEVKAGPLRRLAEDAADAPATPFVLIVDEINRANLAKVFGELYFLLEYRDQSVQLLYGDETTEDFSLPANLFLIGSMNTADRSIALVDAAMRRRFGFVSLHPDDPHVRGVLPGWLAKHRPGDDMPVRLLAELNRRIVDPDFRIGPSYLMRPWVYDDPDGLAEVWETDLLPLLVEHHAGDGIDVRARYGLPALRKAVAPVAGAEGAEPPEPADAAVGEPTES